MQNKKSQITIFIIFGLVLLFITIFSMYIFSLMSHSGPGSRTDLALNVENYIQSCLQNAVEDGIRIIGQQGGYIYTGQKDFFSYQESNITYAIKRPSPHLVLEPNWYPCYQNRPHFTGEMLNWVGEKCFTTYSHKDPQYIFGETDFPDLCKYTENVIPGYVCECIKCDGNSIQDQLEKYVQNKTYKCLKGLDFFKGYNISHGDVYIETVIGSDYIGTTMNLAVEVILPDYSEREKNEFYENTPVRLKRVYDAARKIINNNVNNITFGLVSGGYSLEIPGLRFESKKIANNILLFKIIDDASSLREGPFVFQFLVENRIPALDYLKGDERYIDNKHYLFYVVEGETIEFHPLAFDPDEDELTYVYSGWKVDYDSYWDGSFQRKTDYSGPNVWHESALYKETGRSASYRTTPQDIGEHQVVIDVYDTEGNRDGQILTILVDDKARVTYSIDNYYLDIPNEYISREDPFILDASATEKHIVAGRLIYEWKDLTENIRIPGRYEAYLNMPKDMANVNYIDIENIRDYSFEKEGIHNFLLTLYDSELNQLGSHNKEIDVKQCLPHRNAAPSYPFNNLNIQGFYRISDPFQANHTCCTEYYELSEEGKTCFKLVDYGCLRDFCSKDSYYFIEVPGDKIPQGCTEGYTPPNSVWKRTVEYVCDGIRGNICTKEKTYKVEMLEHINCTEQSKVCGYSTTPEGACI